MFDDSCVEVARFSINCHQSLDYRVRCLLLQCSAIMDRVSTFVDGRWLACIWYSIVIVQAKQGLASPSPGGKRYAWKRDGLYKLVLTSEAATERRTSNSSCPPAMWGQGGITKRKFQREGKEEESSCWVGGGGMGSFGFQFGRSEWGTMERKPPKRLQGDLGANVTSALSPVLLMRLDHCSMGDAPHSYEFWALLLLCIV